MKITINRIYKEEKNDSPLVTVKKVIESGGIESYEESYIFEGLTSVLMYSGESFIVAEPFKEFDEKIINCTLLISCPLNLSISLPPVKIEERIKSIEKNIEETEKNIDTRHKDRLAKMFAGVSTIYVGGITEIERKERKDRVDDAIRATQSALAEGYIIGGAFSFNRVVSCLTASSTPYLISTGLCPCSISLKALLYIALASTTELEVPSPASSAVFSEACLIICAPIFSTGCSRNISLATDTPSLVTIEVL